MATGTASTQEAREATEELLEALMNQHLDQGPIKDMKEYLALIGQLQNLGVSNAKDYVDALQKASMISSIGRDIVNQEKELAELEEKKKNEEITEEEYNEKKADLQKPNDDFIKQYEKDYKIDLSNEEETLLLEKAITAEKAKQNAAEAQIKENEYNAAVKKQEEAKKNVEYLESQKKSIEDDITSWTWDSLTSSYKRTNKNGEEEYMSQYQMEEAVGHFNIIEEEIIDAQKELDGIIIPTKVDAESIEQQAEDAEKVYQDALDKLGLTIQIELYESGQAVDDIQSIFDTLASAQKEYNENGHFTVDTMQSLLELEPKYLDLLVDENGNINLNKRALYDVAIARLTDMKLKQQDAILTEAEGLAATGTIDALYEQIDVMYGESDAYDVLIEKRLESIRTILEERKALADGEKGKLDSSFNVDTYINGLKGQLSAVERVSNSAISNIRNSLSSSGNTAKEDATDAFQKAMKYYENRIGAEQSRFEQVQNEVDLLEKQGKIAGKEYYQEQIASENRRLKLLQQQKAEAKKYLGQFKKGSDEWWEVANQLNDIESELDDVTSSIQDLRDAQAEVDWYIFDETHERFGSLIDDLETIRDLISPNGEEDWFDDDGMWTEKGVASLATYVQALQMYQNALDETNKKLKEYSKPFKGNEKYYKNLGIDSEQELYDAREKLIDQQYDYAKAINDTQQSVVDMYESQIDAIEEWSDKAIEAYNDYIDVVREALDAERDLYEFKKDIQKQTKDIASLERRIASLSGSDSASDIAERRKLEAELAEAKEGLNDSYYDHAKDAQSEALDREAEAYEESMTNYIDTLREKLDQAKLNMDLFMEQVTTAVTMNAGTVLTEYTNTGIAIDKALTEPWAKAAIAMKDYETEALPLMNSWTKAGANGFVYNFSETAKGQLTSPWTAGKNAVTSFESSVKAGMNNVVSNIRTNVQTATGELNKIKSLYAEINDTTVKAPSAPTGKTSGNPTNTDPSNASTENIKALQNLLNNLFNAGLKEDGKWGSKTEAALTKAQTKMFAYLSGLGYRSLPVGKTGKFDDATRRLMVKYIDAYISQMKAGAYGVSSAVGQGVRIYEGLRNKVPVAFHAKGTLGTKRDELAITDESWIGEEITLAAGKNGQLQYLKKGSAVMPADISANLVEWGKLNPDMMNVGGVPNLNMISNAINKPEFNLSFDALVKADRIDEGTLPEIKKYVTQEINSLVKQMNYAIKGFAR